MVMKRNAMRKNLSQSILKSFGRYIAIVMIIALGSALFVGLLMTKADMVATGQVFMDRTNMFDLRLMTSYGWSPEHLEEISKLDGVVEAEAVDYLDLITCVGDSDEERVYRFITIPETINKVELRGGRMPQNANECLAEGFHADRSILGRKVVIRDSNDEDSLESITVRELTVVGYVATPLYMDMNRGTTSVGSGSLTGFYYVQPGVLDLDYIPEINITIPGDYEIYTDRYNDALEAAADNLEPLLESYAMERLKEVRLEAEDAYEEGMEEYRDGLKEFEEGKLEAEQELADAEQELLDGEQEILDNEELLKDGEKQIEDARLMLAESEVTLQESRMALASAKSDAYKQMSDANQELMSNYKTVSKNQQAVNNGLLQIETGMVELESGITQLESGLSQMDSGIEQLQMMVDIMNISIEAAERALEMAGQIGNIEIPTPDNSTDSLLDGLKNRLEKPSFSINLLSNIQPLEETTEPSNSEETDPPTTPTQPDPGETEETEPAGGEGDSGSGEDTQIPGTDPDPNPEPEPEPEPPAGTDTPSKGELQQKLDELIAKRDEYQKQLDDLKAQREQYGAQLDELYATKAELEAQKKELEANKLLLDDAMNSIELGFVELAAAQLQAENQFAAAEAQIDAGEAQIDAAYAQLDVQEEQIAKGWIELEEGRKELEDGWKEFEEAKLEVAQELADAQQELDDAAEELADAWEIIQGMTENDVIILDRNSNVGYNNLDSSSDIVQGVSRVFPVFFILVASLVCITTMTRMIDEERTQIGTLKALGYSNAAIISKYLIYSGSGAFIGCGLGVLLGSSIFPSILWQAYMIMLYIQPKLVLTVNWWLCFAVVSVYMAVLLGVTWYCCRRTLREEPAELIRPKSPEAGKKILMEYLPFWQKISFLNKVTIRNIFRYRQRLAMMLVGIGGCTALLVTGFGLRDSIVNVVDYQFEDVTLYDLEVYFRDPVTKENREDLAEKIGPDSQYMVYHQSSVDLEYDNRVKEIYMIAADDQLQDFIDLHTGNKPLDMPGMDEVVLSVGVSEALGIEVGDTVEMRNSDLQKLTLTVSGIYDNHVYNYSIVAPETIESQWGLPPEFQMAFIQIGEEQDVHTVGAELSEIPDVMNVSISADLASMVRNMMEALDLVVIVIVFCAGLLAVIVLYNLTNININERIREIATIKVLGFNASETGAYVFKENLTLTVVGSIFGLLLGYLLLLFVMSQIKIDMVWFKAMVMPASYIWSAVLTIFAALAVDFIFYFKLQKINMAEALKSVE